MSKELMEKAIQIIIAGKEEMIDKTQVDELLNSIQVEVSFVKEDGYTPTEIGKKLEKPLSAMKVNLVLEELGYQRKKDGKWVVTDKGERVAICKPKTYRLRDELWKIDYELLWKESVVYIIEEVIARKGGEVA